MRAKYIRRRFLTACLSSTLLAHTLNPAHAANYIFSPSKGFGEGWFDNKTKEAVEKELNVQKGEEQQIKKRTKGNKKKSKGKKINRNKIKVETSKEQKEQQQELEEKTEESSEIQSISHDIAPSTRISEDYNKLHKIIADKAKKGSDKKETKDLLTFLKIGVHRWTKKDFKDFYQDSDNGKSVIKESLNVLKSDDATIEEKLIENNKEDKQAFYQLNSDTYRALYHRASQKNQDDPAKGVLLNVLQEFYGSERFLDKKLLDSINNNIKIHICELPDRTKGFDTGNSPHILAVRDVIERYIPGIRSDVFSYMDDLIPDEITEWAQRGTPSQKESIAQWLGSNGIGVTGKKGEKKTNKSLLQEEKILQDNGSIIKNDEHKFHIINRSYEWDKHQEGDTDLARLKDSINDMKGTIQLIDSLTHLDDKGVLVINSFGNEMEDKEKRMEFFDIGKFPTLDDKMRENLNAFLSGYKDKKTEDITKSLGQIPYNKNALHKQFPTENVVAVTNLSNENIIDETSFRPSAQVFNKANKSPVSGEIGLGKESDEKYIKSLQEMTVSAIGSVFVYRPFSPWTWGGSGNQEKGLEGNKDTDKVFSEIAGTSFSAPKVTAMIVLLRAIFSGVIPFKGSDEMEEEGNENHNPKGDMRFFKNIVLRSALRPEGHPTETYGQGLLNFRRALIYGLASVKGTSKEVEKLTKKVIEVLTGKNEEETKNVFDSIKTLSTQIIGEDQEGIHHALNEVIQQIDVLDKMDFEEAHQKKPRKLSPHQGSSDGGGGKVGKKTKLNENTENQVNIENQVENNKAESE